MDHFTIPCAMQINTLGDLNIPANAEVVVTDDGFYAGFVTEDGTVVAHRGFEGAFVEFEAETATAAAPEPVETPVQDAGPTAIALEPAPVEETSGETDDQQAG